MPDLSALISAPGVGPTMGLVLIAASFLTSMTTAALSLGGGTMMVALLSMIWPAAVAIPIHGIIQLGSNAGRVVHRFRDIQWVYAGWFAAGAAVGTAIGGPVATWMPDALFRVAVGLFLIYAAWGPKTQERVTRPLSIAGVGAFTSTLGMIVGASGPLVAGVLRGLPDRRQLVGTHALLMSLQHGMKLIAFGLLGFQFAPYLGLTGAMIVSGFAGTLVGGQLLDRLPERTFRIGFRLILTVLALDLIRRGLSGG